MKPAKISTGRTLIRGLCARCPKCGKGKLFHRWFGFAKTCPSCGYQLEKEEGSFSGSWMINLAIVEILLFALLIVFVIQSAQDKDPSTTTFILVGVVISVVIPILFYPLSKTFWSACELVLSGDD